MNFLFHSKCWLVFARYALIYCVGLSSIKAQNLFRNPSFEKIDTNTQMDCSINFGYNDAVSDWVNINTVDFAHTSTPISIRSGAVKIQPFSGKGMVGVYLIDTGNGSLPEFIFQKPSTPFIAGNTYRIGFQVHFRKQDRYFPDKIQVRTVQENPCKTDFTLLKGETFSIPIKHSSLNDTAWIPVSLGFTPKAAAEFLIIGFFDLKPSVKRKRNAGSEHGVYVFFDDMELINLAPTALLVQAPAEPELEKKTVMHEPKKIFYDSKPEEIPGKTDAYQAIPSVSFDHNSYELAPLFKRILGAMIPDLIKKDCPLLIEGHTDKTGNTDFNRRLAKSRAQAVGDFMITNGFPKDKIRIEVYGSSKPIAIGDDELSLGMNRRVEITQLCTEKK